MVSVAASHQPQCLDTHSQHLLLPQLLPQNLRDHSLHIGHLAARFSSSASREQSSAGCSFQLSFVSSSLDEREGAPICGCSLLSYSDGSRYSFSRYVIEQRLLPVSNTREHQSHRAPLSCVHLDSLPRPTLPIQVPTGMGRQRRCSGRSGICVDEAGVCEGNHGRTWAWGLCSLR